MTVVDKEKIAKKYKIPHWEIMESWLRCLNYIRNIIAHHSRLWSRNLVDQPKLPKKKGIIPTLDHIIGNNKIIARTYVVTCILLHLLSVINPNSSWPRRLKELIQEFPETANCSLSDMGFPLHWDKQNMWNI